MKTLTLKKSVYSLLGICFVSWCMLILVSETSNKLVYSVSYAVLTNIFMFSFMGLLCIGLYGMFRNKESRAVVYSVIIIGLTISFIVAIIFSPRSYGGDGCSETYAGYDTGWSDVCMDDYGG